MAAVQVAVWRATYGGLVDETFLASMDTVRIGTRWASLLAAPPDGVLVAVGVTGIRAQEVVGFAVAGPARDERPAAALELYAVNLLPSVQGTGLADALLDAVVLPGPCALWVVRGNERAMAFYRRRGFLAEGAVHVDDRLGVTEERWVRA